MDFNTLLFPCYFAAAALLYHLLPRAAQPVLLLAASYLFYCWKPANRGMVGLLLAATLVTWLCGLLTARTQNKAAQRALLAVSAACCLGLLVAFKYFNFFAQVVGSDARLDLVAPLGLSYFLFQSLGYAVDQYRGKYPPEKNPVYYALFVSFFPCIFTGPIERADHLLPQLRRKSRFDYDDLAGGAFRMLWGYCKKLILAEHLAGYVSAYYSGAVAAGGPTQAAAAVLFTLQLYFDFSGSCDMAIGGARMLGIHLLENFDNPFLSTSFSELWRRWHKSLNGWFRDYVYIPLGGSRHGAARWAAATLAVFVLSGLWHGAAAGYFWWGLWCGLLVLAEKLPAMLRKGRRAPAAAPAVSQTAAAAGWVANEAAAPAAPQPTRTARHGKARAGHPLPPSVRAAGSVVLRWLRRLLVFAELSVTFIFFAAALYQASPALHPFRALLGGWNAAGWAALQDALTTHALLGGPLQWVVWGGTALVLALESRGNVGEWVRRRWCIVRWPLYLLLAAGLLFFGVFGQSAFIYQQY